MEKEIIISNDLREITHITNFIQEMGSSLQIPATAIMDINLALEEAIVNVIRHAYPNGGHHEIRLRIDISPQEIQFQIIDDGESFDQAQTGEIEGAALEQALIDSLGINLIHQIMDEVAYQSDGEINQLFMKKRLDSEIKSEKTMKMNLCIIDGVAIITLEGRLDTVNAREFEIGIQPLLDDPAPNIIVNCENFSYISSSGIRSFVLLQKSVQKNNGQLVLEAMKPEIRKIFDMTGFSSIFTIR